VTSSVKYQIEYRPIDSGGDWTRASLRELRLVTNEEPKSINEGWHIVQAMIDVGFWGTSYIYRLVRTHTVEQKSAERIFTRVAR
jgi:hypothetical protein